MGKLGCCHISLLFAPHPSHTHPPLSPHPSIFGIDQPHSFSLRVLPVTQVTHVEEEEYCLIPMGGVLPTHPQRVLAIGGTAGMVHPSTGERSEERRSEE